MAPETRTTTGPDGEHYPMRKVDDCTCAGWGGRHESGCGWEIDDRDA